VSRIRATILITLTARAKSHLPDAKARLEDVAELTVTGFSASERDTFLALLRRAVENLGKQGCRNWATNGCRSQCRLKALPHRPRQITPIPDGDLRLRPPGQR
jgi:hypothetical protein